MNTPITAAEVSRILGVTRRTAQRMARDGRLAATKTPGPLGPYVFDRAAVEAFAASRGEATTHA